MRGQRYLSRRRCYSNTTLTDLIAKIEDMYGKARRVWLMDRGIPTEQSLELMRQSGISYLVGTPWKLLDQFQRELADTIIIKSSGLMRIYLWHFWAIAFRQHWDRNYAAVLWGWQLRRYWKSYPASRCSTFHSQPMTADFSRCSDTPNQSSNINWYWTS